LPGLFFFVKITFMPKSWVELTVEIHPFLGEAVANFLTEQGSRGVVQEEIPGPPGRLRERIIAYFPNDRFFAPRRQKIRLYLHALRKLHRSSLHFRSRVFREEKWAEAWKSNFKTLHATSRLVIKPPWENYFGRKGEVVIEINPGMAFGTGTHPSTQMCLEALEQLLLYYPHPPSVLDVGTGSGILAIAARKLGAHKILAIDIDPIAIACARKNAAANKTDGGIEFRVGSLNGLRRVFDIVVANLLPQELLSLAPSLPQRMAPAGTLIVSGLLLKQKKKMALTFAQLGLEVMRSKNSKGWICLVLGWKKKERRKTGDK